MRGSTRRFEGRVAIVTEAARGIAAVHRDRVVAKPLAQSDDAPLRRVAAGDRAVGA